MRITDEAGRPMTNPDLKLGWLEETTRTVHHAAIAPVEAIWHYETLRRYPSGGSDVHRVIDVPGTEAREAWTEEIPIQIYHPYTQEELDNMAAMHGAPTTSARLEKLENALQALEGTMREVMKLLAHGREEGAQEEEA